MLFQTRNEKKVRNSKAKYLKSHVSCLLELGRLFCSHWFTQYNLNYSKLVKKMFFRNWNKQTNFYWSQNQTSNRPMLFELNKSSVGKVKVAWQVLFEHTKSRWINVAGVQCFGMFLKKKKATSCILYTVHRSVMRKWL